MSAYEKEDVKKAIKGEGPGIKGLLIKVEQQNIKDRDGKERLTIIATIKDCEGNYFEVKNNWDGTRAEHGSDYNERLNKAISLIDKLVQTTVAGKYNKTEWFKNIEEIK